MLPVSYYAGYSKHSKTENTFICLWRLLWVESFGQFYEIKVRFVNPSNTDVLELQVLTEGGAKIPSHCLPCRPP